MAAFGRRGKVVGTYRRRPGPGLVPFDLTSPKAAADLVERLRPRTVVCAGADPHVEGCEIDALGTRRVNVEGTLALAGAAERAEASFIFFSSEYVFDGTAGPYAEDAPRNPLNEYGRQKAEVEVALGAMRRALVVRTSGVFGWNEDGKNFVMQLRARLEGRHTLRVAVDQDITPTYVPNLADAVAELAEGGVTGTIHVAASRPITRVDFARTAARVFGLDPALVEPTPTDALGLKAPRPRHAGLSTAKASALLTTRLLDPEEGLVTMRESQGKRSS